MTTAIALPVETYTPALRGNTSNPAVTFTTNVGRYVRIGPLMWLEIQMDWTTVISQGAGSLQIQPPPGVAIAPNSAIQPVVLRNITLPTGASNFVLSGASLIFQGARSGLGEIGVQASELQPNGRIWASGWVRVS